MVKYPALTDCMVWARRHPGSSVPAALLGAVIAMFLMFMVWRIAIMIAPQPPMLLGLSIKNRELLPRYLVFPSSPCTRIGSHVMWRPRGEWTGDDAADAAGPILMETLESSLSGDGFALPSKDITLSLTMPEGMRAGRWEYVYRQLHLCWPFGLVHYKLNTVSVSVIVPHAGFH